jgi:Flp pilus assembly protein TadB
MTILCIISTLLLIVAIVLLFGLTPEQITDDLTKTVMPKQSLRDRAKIAQGKKKSRKLTMEFAALRKAMKATGKERQFTVVCAVSLFLFVGGVILSLLMSNIFLMPVLAVVMAAIPFIHAKSNLVYYRKHVEEEIETALSIISTSYVRSDNIVGSVAENIGYLKPPVRDIFNRFVVETTSIDSDIKAALRRLRVRVDNQIYREWCDCLIQCQDDRTQKTSLLPIVNKLTDVRIVNNELKTRLAEPRKEFWMMVGLVIGNIPLLYILNRAWFETVMFSAFGKIILAVSGIVIAVTALLMMKYTKPVEYKR